MARNNHCLPEVQAYRVTEWRRSSIWQGFDSADYTRKTQTNLCLCTWLIVWRKQEDGI